MVIGKHEVVVDETRIVTLKRSHHHFGRILWKVLLFIQKKK